MLDVHNVLHIQILQINVGACLSVFFNVEADLTAVFYPWNASNKDVPPK